MNDLTMTPTTAIAVHFASHGSVQRRLISIKDVDVSQPTALLGSVDDILDAFDQSVEEIEGVTILGVSARRPAGHYVLVLSAEGRPFRDTCHSENKAQATLEAAWRRAMASADPITEREAFKEAINSISALYVAEEPHVGRQITEAFDAVKRNFDAVSENLANLTGMVAEMASKAPAHATARRPVATGDKP